MGLFEVERKERKQLEVVKELHSHLSKRLRRHSCNRRIRFSFTTLVDRDKQLLSDSVDPASLMRCLSALGGSSAVSVNQSKGELIAGEGEEAISRERESQIMKGLLYS